MLVRVISGVVALALAIALLYFAPPWAVTAVMALLCLLATRELLWGTKLVQNRRMVAVSCLAAAGVPVWNSFGSPALVLQGALALLIVYFFVECIASHGKLPFAQITISLFGALVLPYAISSLFRIYLHEQGKVLIWVPMIAAWASDCCALFGGILWGKHKLAPVISPKKTVEGSISGVFGSVIVMLIFVGVADRFFDLEIGYGVAALLGAAGAVIGQVGDLSFSAIKRQCGIKDYGKIMPGHGGVLDRFDSIIFTSMTVEVLWKWLG